MNHYKIITLAVFLLSFFTASAQVPELEWVKTTQNINDHRNSDVAVDHLGNVFTVGSFEETVDFDPGTGVVNLTATSQNYNDIFIRKLDANGNFLWVKKINASTQVTELQSIAVDDSGNVLIAGCLRHVGVTDLDPGPGTFYASAPSSGGFAPFLVKLDTQGNFIWGWSVASTGTQPMDIATDDSCNVYLVGEYSGTFPGFANAIGYDGFLIKFRSNGAINWRYRLSHPSSGGGISDRISSVAVDTLGNVYTTGYFAYNIDFDPGPGTYTMGSTGVRSPFIMKLDRNRNFIWARQLECLSSQANKVFGNSIAVDDSGNVYTTGCFDGMVDFDPGPATFNLTGTDGTGNEDSYIHKLRSDGSFAWVRRFGNMYMQGGNDIEIGPSGTIYTVGYFSGTVDFDPGPGQYTETGGNFVQTYNHRGVFIHKMHPAGTLQYVFSYYDGAVPSMAIDSYENLYLNGMAYTADFDPDTNVYYPVPTGGWYFTAKYSNCTSTSSSQTVSACGSYTVNGQTYSSSGTYTQVIANSTGCDSVITWNITITPGPVAGITRTACNSYTLNGQTYTASGTYTQIRPSGNGCDTTLTLNLTIRQSTSSTINATACNSYTLNGQTYTTSGTYTQLRTNSQGCDSTITLNLVIKHSTTSTINATACNSYTLNGQTYTTSGTYTQLRTNSQGCDSTITLNLVIKHSTTATINQTACDSYTLNGQTYTTSGTYTQVRTNSQGCDSTITLNLVIHHSTASVINASTCTAYMLNGQQYTTSGTYTQTLTNSQGCDSTITLNLSILPATFSLHTDTVCNSYTMNGQTYYQSGTYKQTLAGGGSNGCDSVIIMQLVIYPPAIATLTETVCGSYTLNGQTYTTSGNYSQTLFNASATGCDSIIVLDLTILPDASSMQTVTACNSYTWNGQTYTASGTYTQVFPSSLDCDSTVTLQLTLTPVDASVTYVNETLTATMPGATYQWIECSGEAISGATAQEFHATANGSYAVIVTLGNCTDTSDCVAIFTVGLEPSAEDIRLTVYPNPGNGIFYIFSENLDKPMFEIYDLAGKYIRNLQGGEMLSTYSVNISDLAKGTYLLRITDRDKTFIRRIILR